MHLFTIVVYALLFWQNDQAVRWELIEPDDVGWTLLIALGPIPLAGFIGWWTSRRWAAMLERGHDRASSIPLKYHRTSYLVRVGAAGAFALALFATPWPDWFAFGEKITPALQFVGDLIVLAPFFLATTAHWVAAHPIERALRTDPVHTGSQGPPALSLRHHTESFVRGQILIFAVPLTIILLAADIANGYRAALTELTGVVWAADGLVGVVALGVFVLAPEMLRRIWVTEPMPDGPLRRRLDAICSQIGLRCRDILVWKSHGTIINAAVMGVLPRVRYVLLSDGLLDAMSDRQVEAVFGHEAGHVKHHHIPHFLVFALIGWLAAAGVIEFLLCIAGGPRPWIELSTTAIQGIGLAATAVVWGLGFGWVSRRFEREADVFGARCVMPPADACDIPCSVHLDTSHDPMPEHRVCASGAAVFASALNRVAALNGIPREERSWRHSSIGNRIRCLTMLSGDPNAAARFTRLVRRIKVSLVLIAAIGSAGAIAYGLLFEPALMKP